jgi:hypothetical protein
LPAAHVLRQRVLAAAFGAEVRDVVYGAVTVVVDAIARFGLRAGSDVGNARSHAACATRFSRCAGAGQTRIAARLVVEQLRIVDHAIAVVVFVVARLGRR